MSLILDALRKSERTRQQTLTGQLSATDAAPRRAHAPVPWATLIGILLVANALVLAIIFWRTHASSTASLAVDTQMTGKVSSTAISTPAYRPAIRSLAEEAAAVNVTTAVTATHEPAATLRANPASMAPADTQVPTRSTGSAATLTTSPAAAFTGDAPALDTLPLAFQQSLPPLHLDVHGYAQNPADRFVVINMQRYQIGETLKEGPKVIAITTQGVILDYNGQRFLLPRL